MRGITNDGGSVDGAFGVWIERYRPRAVRLVARRLGPLVQRAVEAEDVVQEASLVAVDAYDRIEPTSEGGLLSWFMRIAENRIRNIARQASIKSAPRRSTPLPLAAVVSEAAAERETTARSHREADVVSQRESAGSTLDTVCVMRPDHRAVLTLQSVLGVSWGTVGFLVERQTIQASRQLLRRARCQF